MDIIGESKNKWLITKERLGLVMEIYLSLFRDLEKLYKKEKELFVEVAFFGNKKFVYTSSMKIYTLELEEDYIFVMFDNGCQMFVNKQDEVSYDIRGDVVYKNQYIIINDSGDCRVRIDCDERY